MGVWGPALGSRVHLPVTFGSPHRREADELEVFRPIRVGERKRTFVEPLYEVDFSLVLPGFRGFDGSPFPTEGYVPAVILGVLKGGVVVLQDYLGEDAVPASAAGLWEHGHYCLLHIYLLQNNVEK